MSEVALGSCAGASFYVVVVVVFVLFLLVVSIGVYFVCYGFRSQFSVVVEAIEDWEKTGRHAPSCDKPKLNYLLHFVGRDVDRPK